MSSFLRHVGKHGDRKVAIVFRELPGEEHMCLVVYTETLGKNIHDPLIQCVESDIGQNSKNLADALNRSYTLDGNIILQKLHIEGMMKKVNTEQIVMTPSPATRIKLSELNKILDEMEKGEEATRKLAEMDNQLGIQSPVQVAKRMRDGEPGVALSASPDGALDNSVLAESLRQQAERMSREANGLIAEANRLISEAEALVPSKKQTTKRTRTPKNIPVT